MAGEVYELWRGLEHRRGERQRRGGNGRIFRCFSCKQIVRNPRALCSCGYDGAAGWLS